MCVFVCVGVQVPQSTLEIGRKITESSSPVAHMGPPSEQELEQGLALERARNLQAVRLVLSHSLTHSHT